MSGKSHEYLCKALELAEEAGTFFEKTLQVCEDGLGKEVFGMLADQGARQKELIDEVYSSLERGEDWAGACSLDESDKNDVRGVFQSLAEKHVPQGACATEVTAARAAMDMQAAAVDFYDSWLSDAGDPVEKKFVEHMLGELRMQRVLLADLVEYYDDPEGWAMAQDHAGLDGA
ncbi:ferritin family protein [Paucidesulfovibrio longus]|uniref:hypothetical protein n=1 Tax=Paucidesulfovibrio longus TaxID=889 RepID=UPI0003B3B941|nr:hypothetical protein [Paucidesulfovibrio longus]